MTKVEEHKALDEMWQKIQKWVGEQPRFSRTRAFKFPHAVYSWTKFEVYTDGTCAILTGSHGNPGENRPHMIRGFEEFEFGMGDGGMSWYGDLSDLPKVHEPHSGVTYCSDYRVGWKWRPNYGYSLLSKLFDNWQHIKCQIVSAIESNRRLENFEA